MSKELTVYRFKVLATTAILNHNEVMDLRTEPGLPQESITALAKVAEEYTAQLDRIVTLLKITVGRKIEVTLPPIVNGQYTHTKLIVRDRT